MVMDVFPILGGVHYVSFFLFLILMKFVLKKAMRIKYCFAFIFAWMIFILMLYAYGAISSGLAEQDPWVTLASMMGYLTGIFLAFTIVDGIMLGLGSWIYKKVSKKDDK